MHVKIGEVGSRCLSEVVDSQKMYMISEALKKNADICGFVGKNKTEPCQQTVTPFFLSNLLITGVV